MDVDFRFRTLVVESDNRQISQHICNYSVRHNTLVKRNTLYYSYNSSLLRIDKIVLLQFIVCLYTDGPTDILKLTMYCIQKKSFYPDISKRNPCHGRTGFLQLNFSNRFSRKWHNKRMICFYYVSIFSLTRLYAHTYIIVVYYFIVHKVY